MSRKQFIFNLLPRTASQADNFADRYRAVGFSEARMHHIVSWKHGVLGSDLPGVLVIEAER